MHLLQVQISCLTFQIGTYHQIGFDVIEASNIASGQISGALLSSKLPEFNEIPFNILSDLFQQLESSWSNSSYTRRGAGIPGLIQKFVASEPSNKPKQLLPFTIKSLLDISMSEAPKEASEASDSPISHSIHILKSLVQVKWATEFLGMIYLTY